MAEWFDPRRLLKPTFWAYIKYEYFASAATRADRRRFATMDRQAERMDAHCEICNNTAVYLCPVCREPIQTHTHENDFICETHSFVNPIRQLDGARINGDGRTSDAPRVIGVA